MSDESYVDLEFRYVPEAHKPLKIHVNEILSIINNEGHSGGSMGIYSGMMEYWKKDPTEPEKDSLHYPIWVYLKDNVPVEDHKQVLEYVSKLMTYTPLSPLTGEDDEWMIVYEDEDPENTTIQNRRMASVFKSPKRGAYWLDGEIHHHPSSGFDWWLGLTGSYSVKPIIFPFDPNTKPIRRYFRDTDCESELHGNPNLWLREQKRLFRLGHNLNDFKDEGRYVASRVILNTKEDTNIVLNAVKHFYSFNHKLSVKELNQKLDEMTWKADDIFFRTETVFKSPVIKEAIEEPCFADNTVEQAVSTSPGIGLTTVKETERNITHLRSVFHRKDSNDAQWYTLDFMAYSHMANFIRLVTEIGIYEYITEEELDKYLILNPVKIPSRNYQEWINDPDKTHVSFNRPVVVEYDKNAEYPQLNITDERAGEEKFLGNKYLYMRCKQLGLEYKGRK